MKTTIVAYGISLCMAALHALIPPPIASSYELAEKVIAALQRESASDYAALLPTTGELSQLVEDNQEFYGPHLMEAKADLERSYNTSTIPEMKRTFEKVIEEGRNRGIEWDKIKLETVKLGATENDIHIIFSYKGAYHQIRLEKALRIRGDWRATQFITFI